MSKTYNFIITALIATVSTVNFAQQSKNQDYNTILTFKVGALGGWLSYEQPIINDLVIHLEYGQEYGLYGSTNEGTEVFSTATLSIETRYYYNRETRLRLNKSLVNNSGNYLALEIQRVPDWMTSNTGERDLFLDKNISIVPKIGMKRNIGKAMTFELAGGIGYMINETTDNNIILGLDLKLGFLLFKI